MKLLGVIALLLVVLIVFVALLVVLYKNFNGRIVAINEKLDGAKNEFDDKYKDKLELVKKFIAQIESKYKVESIQPFDMFPQTAHIETVVHLKHK